MLDRAGRAALSGTPADALPLLDAVLDAVSASRGASVLVEPALVARAGWLRGVALAALGRYAPALSALRAARARQGDDGDVVAVRVAAAATAAALLRQISDHAAGERWDALGIAEAQSWQERHGASPDALTEAVLDCRIGHTADAVGLGHPELAAARLVSAQSAPRPVDGRRCAVRSGWVDAEVALLVGDTGRAFRAAQQSWEMAQALGSVRHVAKSAMFVGVAGGLSTEGAMAVAEARAVLLRGVDLADGHGLLPLVWPLRAVLATMPGMAVDDREAADHLARARAAVGVIAAALPEPRRFRWFARDPMAGFLAGADPR